MDFGQFDSRKASEDGVFCALMHPYTGEMFGKGKDAPGFMVRGIAARSVQLRLADMQRQAKADAKAEDDRAAMERLHESLIDGAMKYIIRADDAMKINGEPVGSDPEMIRRVLDTTFPEMKVVKDASGNPVMSKAKNDKGEEIEVPKFEIVNKTFAQQVIEAAEDGSRFFGKIAKA